ncbi:hypothetical protein MNEG_9137 [Monoraphidium neglectum]|uniref:J domain-containing protein n=1 Tax=Monoraphidium neglectum TaxID=145388 RepID=A0A0D2KTM6_9CHLO|nr:hypothetical protein MNEG_9137 [Monoraphidium neglectum]KIY98823.1 hypothetical protein MNEG_9137 [Monoraphidium neglectum]|eukprot:XP_013897843.1 hypothetical protein MNEG_9137 [Monoraphidium neglectum]
MSVDNDGAPAGGGPAAADTTADTAATRGSGPLLARVLALASRGLQQGEWRECCERAAAAARLDPSSKEARQLWLLGAILQRAQGGGDGFGADPWELLSLADAPLGGSEGPQQQQQQQQQQEQQQQVQGGPRGAGAARRLYRRLAALVHPDKCADPSWAPAAHAAFKAAAAARDAALRLAGAGAGGGQGSDGDWGGDEEGDGGDAACCDKAPSSPGARHLSSCKPRQVSAAPSRSAAPGGAGRRRRLEVQPAA